MNLKIVQIIGLLILPALPVFGSGVGLGTRQQTVRPVALATNTTVIFPSAVSNYAVYGYSSWNWGPGEDAGQQTNLMPAGYTRATNTARLLNFFTLTDVHITDKESPNLAVYAGYHGTNSSAYSPVMLYSTHVLDAAVRTVNALHRLTPFDFGIFLGDVGNSPQHNELRWFIDVLDGKYITPSSGAHLGADTIDYQKPYQAAGLDRSIPWYQTLGNHDHWWLGAYPVIEYFRQAYTNETILLLGDPITEGVDSRTTFMGSINGGTPYGDVIGAGPVSDFVVGGVTNAPKVAADTNRYALTKSAWMSEFFTTSSKPVGHGFTQANVTNDFACYSFEPKTNMPIKVIVLDDTQADTNFDIRGHGGIDTNRFDWLVDELDKGQAEDKLMIIAAHIPIELIGYGSSTNLTIARTNLLAKLHTYPNLILWISGHVHRNKVTPQPSPYADRPEYGFWEVETASLRDFPQQFRTFEILRNTDNTVSILATDVDPSVTPGSPADISRGYAVGAARIFGHSQFGDTTSHAYNAELIKLLSPPMQEKIAGYGEPLGRRVSIDPAGTGVVAISFIGQLQSADTLHEPAWNNVSDATNSPYTMPAPSRSKFYRAAE